MLVQEATRKRVLVVLVLLSTLSSFSYAESISSRRLVEVADFSDPVISPDGEKVAFRVERASIERNTYDSEWYVQDIDDAAAPLRVADGGTPLRDFAGNSAPAMAVWSRDGRWIYYRALVDGRIDVWRAAVDGSGAAPVTHDPADVRAFSLSADGRQLRYSVGIARADLIAAEEAEYDHGIRIDETVPIAQSLFRSGYVNGRLATQRFTGDWFELRSLRGHTPDQWKAVDVMTGAVRNFPPADIPSQPPAALDLGANAAAPWKFAVESNGNRIALLTRIEDGIDGQEGPLVTLAMHRSGKSPQMATCSDVLCIGKSITGIQWRPGSDEILFTVTDPREGRAQSIFGWNVESNLVRPVVQARGLVGGGGRYPFGACGVSPVALVCITADADQPPRLERIELDTGERQVLFDPNAALEQDLVKFTPAQLLRWSDSQGRKFTGQLFPARRTGGMPPPLFIVYYSCDGFVRGGVGDELPLATFAEHGISALCINRLEGFTLDAALRHDEGRMAVESVIDLLASRGEIDRTRVGMGGLSLGGAVALWTATESDVLAAVSVSSPVVTPNYYLFNSLRGAGFTDELKSSWGLGAPDETPERWKELSPAFKVDKVSAPILFQNSEQEYLYGLEYTLPLIRRLQAEMYVYPNEPHLKFQPRHKLSVYERNLDWFRYWLQDADDGDPRKSDQYVRWGTMKAARFGASGAD
jgi:hypothetical protein